MKKTALVLAASLALGGAIASAASAAPAAAKGDKTITVGADLTKSPIACSVDLPDVTISKKGKEKVKWSCSSDIKKLCKNLKITWYDGSPFAKEATQNSGGDWDSDDVAPDAGEKEYRYGFALTLKDGRSCMVDPRIIVVP